MNDRLQRRTAIGHAKPTGFDLGNHLSQTTPDRAKILDALVP
jgi:hypothetical protein